MSIFVAYYTKSLATEFAGKGKFISMGQNVILHVTHLETLIFTSGTFKHLIIPVSLRVQDLADPIMLVRLPILFLYPYRVSGQLLYDLRVLTRLL